MPIIDSVLAATELASRIKPFVESQDFASILAEVELDAAARAISNLSETIDRRSQIWNIVNHLETAFSATLNSLKNEAARGVLTASVMNEVNQNKLRLYQCLLAVCYASLGENKLCRQAITIARTSHKLVNHKDGLNTFVTAVSMFAIPIIMAVDKVKTTFDPMMYKRFHVTDDQLMTLEAYLDAALT